MLPAFVRVIAVAIALVAMAPDARADAVTDLIGQLRSGDSKIRLSAALALPKLGDQRAVAPMTVAVGDNDRNVRAAAAIGLGKLITDRTRSDLKKAAVAALNKAAQKDSSDIVRKKAQEALGLIGDAGGGGSTAVASGGVFVDVGPMSASDATIKEAMRKATLKTFGRVASQMATAWPGGRSPKKSELDAKGIQAFHVDGNVTELKSTGGTVSCKISMLIATYPDKSMFGFLKGGASVQGGSSPRDVELSRQDCVMAVVEDMVAKKIVPTIKMKAGSP